MTEHDEQQDRDQRLRAEPGEEPRLADRLTAAAYRREIDRILALSRKAAG